MEGGNRCARVAVGRRSMSHVGIAMNWLRVLGARFRPQLPLPRNCYSRPGRCVGWIPSMLVLSAGSCRRRLRAVRPAPPSRGMHSPAAHRVDLDCASMYYSYYLKISSISLSISRLRRRPAMAGAPGSPQPARPADSSTARGRTAAARESAARGGPWPGGGYRAYICTHARCCTEAARSCAGVVWLYVGCGNACAVRVYSVSLCQACTLTPLTRTEALLALPCALSGHVGSSHCPGSCAPGIESEFRSRL